MRKVFSLILILAVLVNLTVSVGAVTPEQIKTYKYNESGNNKSSGISISPKVLAGVNGKLTISFWQYAPFGMLKNEYIFHATKNNSAVIKVIFTLRDGAVYWSAGMDSLSIKPGIYQIQGGWNHWAFTKNSATGDMKIYLNGMKVAQAVEKKSKINVPDKMTLGSKTDYTKNYSGNIDEFTILPEELNAERIKELYLGSRASEPSPADGSNLLKKGNEPGLLSWEPGKGAISHDIYFGTSETAVSSATQKSPEYKGKSISNSFKPDVKFDKNKTYYWRIDEVSKAGAVKGHVWKFGYNEWNPAGLSKMSEETQSLIEKDFRIKGQAGYYEDKSQGIESYCWPSAVEILALNKAAQMKPDKYGSRLKEYIKSIDRYWTKAKGIWGYDCSPNPGLTNRFYDDNSWMAWALTEAYEVTGDKAYLKRAEDTLKFVLSGEDQTFGGGIWWKETYYSDDPPKCKAVSATAGGALAAAKIYSITGEEAYRKNALRLLEWLNTKVRDKNGLVMNDVTDGVVGRNLWVYNTSVPLCAYAILYGATKNEEYLEQALSLAKAADSFFVNNNTGGINDGGYFAFTLAEGWLELYKQTGDVSWLGRVDKTIQVIYKYRDKNGRFQDNWDPNINTTLSEWRLLGTAPVARLFWAAAAVDKSPAVKK